MTHQDAGHYSAKHGPAATCPEALSQALSAHRDSGEISCAQAHQMATRMAVLPAEVGRCVDLLEIKLTQCQMLLFGHSPKTKPLQPAMSVSAELASAIQGAVKEKKIACAACWALAAQLGVSRPEVAAACEKLGIKISPCQLGAF